MKKKYLLFSGTLLVILALFVLFNPLSSLRAQDEAAGRIAVVDVQEVFEAHPEKESAEEQLNKEAQSMQSDLEDEAKDLTGEKKQQLVQDYQSQLSQKEQELIKGILKKIQEAIKEVAAEKDVKIVMEKKNVIYGGYDLTQDVIDYIKAQHESK